MLVTARIAAAVHIIYSIRQMAPMSIPSMVPWAVVLGLRKFHPFCSVHGRDQHTDGHTD